MDNIFVELPPKKRASNNKVDESDLDLKNLFSTEEEGEFLGFENFDSPENSNYNELRALFSTDDVEEEFHGFETSVNLEQIFLSDKSCDDDEVFIGF